ncbi:hypothetical protein F5X68DRAFT_2209 [Plectosphaerella plurivora]|uniref:Pleckstrin homology domain-containing protein n=1 Tax=Plectosphaerella plurivora TaxID=936078 RepID=A0A9P8VMD5_9PEZI|nr:hypothetical protein F5X68DRAFT_2209 [Plectosphaerella plurivora]
MTAWETEDEYAAAAAAASLPTPRDTPYRTPSSGSKRSRRSITPPGTNSSPSIQPAGGRASRRSSKDVAHDEGISVLDPRRFTPTLHANLVAEILNLRRDQEDKIKLIEGLEVSLHASREEQETVQKALAATSKESRSLKRQLQLLEGGSSSALGELARERDEAVDSITDTRKRLEAAQKKIRHQEQDSERIHEIWTQEKESWEEEKRKFERKVHVAESRLKVLLEEVAAYQDAQANGLGAHGTESEAEDPGKETDAASVRTMSMTNSLRFSVMPSPGKGNGNSLADELNLDGDDDWHTDDGGRESAMSYHRHARHFSRDSTVSKFHRRTMSIESLKRPGSVARGKLWVNEPVLEALEGENEPEAKLPEPPKVTYVDTGIQFSPPPSPKLEPVRVASPPPRPKIEAPVPVADLEGPPRGEFEIEANQRRKRVQLTRPLSIEPTLNRPHHSMVSAASQTLEEPLSPPKTPVSPYRSLTPPPPETAPPPPPMISTSTQTEKEAEPEPAPRLLLPTIQSMPQLPIPSISVIPPTSRPATPKEHRLPLYNKDVGCQVSLISSGRPTKSVAVQTEEIRIDQRIARLPLHLRPEAISSRPVSPNPQAFDEGNNQFTPVPGSLPPRNPRRLTSKHSMTEMPSSPPPPIPSSPTFSGAHDGSRDPLEDSPRDAYPGNNDDGPLSSQKAPMRRPHRISSLFAGFDANSSDEADDFAGELDLSDSEYQTALSAPGQRAKASIAKLKRVSSGRGIPSSDQTALRGSAIPRNTVKPLGTETYSYSLENHEMIREEEEPQHSSFPKSSRRSYDKSAPGPSSGRPNGMRKAALIQSGIASHQGRARSPSWPEPQDPPFPIPTRASSRRPPISASAPSDGQRSPSRGESWHRRGAGSRSHYRSNSIRKVRSAAALPRNQRYNKRQGSRSPPPFSETTEAPESPGLPPLPQNDITSPRLPPDYGRSRYKSSHRSQPSTTTAHTTHTAQTYGTNTTTDHNSVGSASATTGVVDAIAQTMVGEWMFKYVRRRKSFGVPEAGGKDDNSNDRHKRWVWLAPYERAILWSSKQPASGSALMGKTGRKLTIQSVLDVKDDNPPPKGCPALFNRSILILTPQRALKFTATSSERHYIWLTALSFLAHSQQAVPEIIAAPPPPKTIAPDFEMPVLAPKKRAGIRDSIRLTKSKTPQLKQGVPSLPPLPTSNRSAPSSQMGDVSSFRQHEPFPPLPEMSPHHERERSAEAAEPPFIPRFHDRANPAMVHGRKRSNTGGHVPPPLSFRGFSGPAVTTGSHSHTNSNAGNSVGTAGSSDIYQSHQSQASSGGPSWGMSTAGSQRTSEASSRPSNFFDAIGTVRMEAFISPLGMSQFDGDPDEHDEHRYRARRRSKELRRRASRSRHRDSYTSRGTRATDDFYGGSRTAGEEDFFRDDPFKGF